MKDTKVAWNPSYSELIVIVRNRSSYRVPTVAKRLASLVYFNTAGLLWHSLNDGTYEGCCAPPGSGVKQICPVPWTPLELLPSSQFYNMNKSLRNSSIPMQMRCSSLNGHSPQTQGTPKDADVETWHEAKKSCPWSMEKYERALNYDLPKPVAQALDGWMKASQATAIITALLAAVQGGMIAVIDALPDSDDSPVWRTFRGFVYAGLFFDLGATLSSVYIIVQGAALPVLARRKAMDTCASKSIPYLQIHEPDHMMPRGHLDGCHGVQILEEFGMDRLWRYVAHHMLWNFVFGYMCLIMSIILWVCAIESTALVVPIVVVAVGTAGPVYGFLRFIIPL